MMGKKILLVDDDKDLLYGMKIWLRANNYHVLLAQDGPAAIAAAQAGKPDLIILDIGLPGGDGYLLMSRIRSLTPLAAIPILVITAKEASVHREKSLEAGAEAFFQKPLDHHRLLAAIRQALAPKAAARSRPSEPAQKAEAPAGGKKILIVDDDPDLLQALRVRLKSCGFHISLAQDGVQGLALALKVNPDLILLDIGLPGGDGYLTMSRLRAHLPLAHVPIFIITAADASVHEEKAREAGADAFFQKPIDNHQLLAALRKALGGPEKSPPVSPAASPGGAAGIR